MQSAAFEIRKDDLKRWRWVMTPLPSSADLAEGEVLARIVKFGFTANNVTYARLGGELGYWQFFPSDEGWGQIPVWGIAEVVQSALPSLVAGERFYGYLPMASHARLRFTPPQGTRLNETSDHRAALPSTYNEYWLIDRDPSYELAKEDPYLVLRPLFGLSYFCARHVRDSGYFGARRAIISSASSKSSLGMAHLLQAEKTTDLEVIGLTSAANLDFVRADGRFDRELTYDEVGTLSDDIPAIFIDVAGNRAVRSAVHHALPNSLVRSLSGGFTHWETSNDDETIPGPAPEFFFAPAHIMQLRKEVGSAVLREQIAAGWDSYLHYMTGWLRVATVVGQDGVARVYEAVLNGARAPQEADILSV
jgi:hypothetical protein